MSRRQRITLIIEAVVIVAAVITIAVVVVNRTSGTVKPADQAASAPLTSASGSAGTAAPLRAQTPQSPGGVPTTTRAPQRFGAITVTDQVLHAAPAAAPRFQIIVHYPVISGLADTARQDRINAQLRTPADQALAGFTADFGTYPPDAGDNGFATVTNEVSAAGRLLSIRFDIVFRFPGARAINGGVNAVTVRLDTGEPIRTSAMFTPVAKGETGVRTLAFALKSQNDIPDCNANPQYGDRPIRDGITKALRDEVGGAAVTATSGGLRFSFAAGTIGPSSCGVLSGTLTFTLMRQLVDPALVTLATSL